MKKSIFIALAVVLTFGVLVVNTQAALVPEKPNIWEELANSIKQIFYPSQYSAFSYDVSNNSQDSLFNPFSQYQGTQFNTSNTASDTSGYNCNQTSYTCVKTSSNAKYQGSNALNDCNKACKAPSSSSSNQTNTWTNTNSYSSSNTQSWTNTNYTSASQTQTQSQTQTKSNTQTSAGSWQTTGGFNTNTGTGAGTGTGSWQTTGGFNTNTGTGAGTGANTSGGTTGGAYTFPGVGTNQWNITGGYTTPGIGGTNLNPTQWNTTGGSNPSQWITTGGSNTGTSNQLQTIPTTGTGNLWTGFFNGIKDLLGIPTTSNTTDNTKGDNKTTVPSMKPLDFNIPLTATSTITNKEDELTTNKKDKEGEIRPLGWNDIVVYRDDTCNIKIAMQNPNKVYHPGEEIDFVITQTNCKKSIFGYIGFSYYLNNKPLEDYTGWVFANGKYFVKFVLPFGLAQEAIKGKTTSFHFQIHTYQCLIKDGGFCLDEIKNRHTAHYKEDSANFFLEYVGFQEGKADIGNCTFELVDPGENITISQHPNPMFSTLDITLRINCPSSKNAKLPPKIESRYLYVDYSDILCRDYETGNYQNYWQIINDYFGLGGIMSHEFIYTIPGEQTINVDQLDLSQDLLRLGRYTDCLLKLKLTTAYTDTHRAINSFEIVRKFYLDSCQVDLELQEPNKEYYTSKDEYIPMKMIFNCDREDWQPSPTYAYLTCLGPSKVFIGGHSWAGGPMSFVTSKNNNKSYNLWVPMKFFEWQFKDYLPPGTKYHRFNCYISEYTFYENLDTAFWWIYDKTFCCNDKTKPIKKIEVLVHNDGPYSSPVPPTSPTSSPKPIPTTTPTGGGGGTNSNNTQKSKNWFQTIFAPIIRFFQR